MPQSAMTAAMARSCAGVQRLKDGGRDRFILFIFFDVRPRSKNAGYGGGLHCYDVLDGEVGVLTGDDEGNSLAIISP